MEICNLFGGSLPPNRFLRNLRNIQHNLRRSNFDTENYLFLVDVVIDKNIRQQLK